MNGQTQPKKPIFRRWWFWVISIAVLSVIVFGGFSFYRERQYKSSFDDVFVTSAPIDLEQIAYLSQFRSCAGHDYSGKNIEGQTETMRSMKHYATPLETYKNTKDQVKIFAPFDGKVEIINYAGQKEMGGAIYLSPLSSPTWTFQISHIYPFNTLKTGSKVKAGDLIGYAEVRVENETTITSFDLALQNDNLMQGNRENPWTSTLDSFLNRSTSEVVGYFSKYGLTKEAVITSKEYRDQYPCKEEKTPNGGVNFVSSGGDRQDYILLNR